VDSLRHVAKAANGIDHFSLKILEAVYPVIIFSLLALSSLFSDSPIIVEKEAPPSVSTFPSVLR